MNIQSVDLFPKNRLFRDYLYDFERVSRFYNAHPRNNWTRVVKERSQQLLDRDLLGRELQRQQMRWGASEVSLKNCDLLNNKNTFAVVTGQQAGIAGGPLYTFYKIITAIKLCRQLSDQFPEYNFVPVFWLEIYDNDFDEISRVSLLDGSDELQTLQAKEKAEEVGYAVAFRQVGQALDDWRGQIDGYFYDTDFKAAVLDRFVDVYQSDSGFGDGFARLLLSFFADQGLVIIDPTSRAFCDMLGPLYTKVVKNSDAALSTLMQRTTEIESAGYSPQISFREDQTLMFACDEDGLRMRIDRDSAGHFLLNHPDGKKELSEADLLLSCKKNPFRLSPNVALRPIVQDSLLPTVAYIGGPSEIAYFAQISALYDFLDVPMPVIRARHRLTIIEKKVQRLIEKNDVDLSEVLNFDNNIVENTLRRGSGQRLSQLTASAKSQINEALASLREDLENIDPGLVSGYEKTRGNIENAFDKLRGRIDQVLQQRNSVQVQQIERVLRNLAPGGEFQERTLNMMQFCIKYGLDFPLQILEALPEDEAPHYLLML